MKPCTRSSRKIETPPCTNTKMYVYYCTNILINVHEPNVLKNHLFRSAHTLRTHMEDKHTICPGYRCVLCGTVAKSRNSLHSHMSRQHRGISTKDLPVLPMPSPFDPDLASKLLSKAGVKVFLIYSQLQNISGILTFLFLPGILLGSR